MRQGKDPSTITALEERPGTHAGMGSCGDLYDLAPVAYVILNHRGEIIRLNQVAIQLLSWDHEPLLGHSLGGFVAPQDDTIYKHFLRRAIGATGREQCELALRQPCSPNRQVIMVARWDHCQQELMTVLVDITERREAEQRLGTHLAALSLLHDVITQSHSTHELQPLMQAVVKAAASIAGSDMGLLQTLNTENGTLCPAAHHACPTGMIEHLTSPGSALPEAGSRWLREQVLVEDIESHDSDIPMLNILRGAGARAMLWAPMLSHKGRFHGVLITLWKTPHRASAIALDLINNLAGQVADALDYRINEYEREQLVQLVENSVNCVTTADLQGNLTYINPAGRRMFGLTAEQDVAALRLKDLAAPEWHDFLADTVLATVREKGRWTGEMQLRNLQNGTLVDVLRTTFLIRDPETGIPWCYATVNQDITEAKRAEEELKQLHGEMHQLLQMQIASQTTAALAHEINQPLNAVTTYSEAALQLLKKPQQHPEKLARALEGISLQAARAGRVVRELLNFLNKGETTRETLDLKDVINEAMVVIKATERRNFRIVTELSAEAQRVEANRLQISKVIAVLLQNGIDAMNSAGVRGQISISVRPDEDGSQAHITIQDQGPGIDAATAKQIFDAFFTTKPRGIGMGLTISRALIEANGGKLWCSSEPGKEACFHFTLPLASQPHES